MNHVTKELFDRFFDSDNFEQAVTPQESEFISNHSAVSIPECDVCASEYSRRLELEARLAEAGNNIIKARLESRLKSLERRFQEKMFGGLASEVRKK